MPPGRRRVAQAKAGRPRTQVGGPHAPKGPAGLWGDGLRGPALFQRLLVVLAGRPDLLQLEAHLAELLVGVREVVAGLEAAGVRRHEVPGGLLGLAEVLPRGRRVAQAKADFT